MAVNILTKKFIDKFERAYGKGEARIVLYSDWSGYTEKRDGEVWKYNFSFADMEILENIIDGVELFEALPNDTEVVPIWCKQHQTFHYVPYPFSLDHNP